MSSRYVTSIVTLLFLFLSLFSCRHHVLFILFKPRALNPYPLRISTWPTIGQGQGKEGLTWSSEPLSSQYLYITNIWTRTRKQKKWNLELWALILPVSLHNQHLNKDKKTEKMKPGALSPYPPSISAFAHSPGVTHTTYPRFSCERPTEANSIRLHHN